LNTLAFTAICLYGFFLLFIFLYSLVQLNLAIQFVKKNKRKREMPVIAEDDFPYVTVQLPVFNEMYVIERLINAVCEFDYPKNKLEIQVLDDGNDESVEIAAKLIVEKQKLGIDIQHIRRTDRQGFKAGALSYGLDISKGEFTAIFDADFVPRKDFLRQTIPFFYAGEKIAVVQTRWEHLNEDYSLLTRLQAFGLDAHFTVEQIGRNYSSHYINFNGTAGVWRKEAIYDAGGWQSDTITEDLDLSYRAQLCGWNFIYLPAIGSPSELPAEMNALKAQQFRWTKGAAECTRKNLGKVLRAKDMGFAHKVHASFHLMNSVVFLSILGTSILSMPMLFIKHYFDGWHYFNGELLNDYSVYFAVASAFLVSFFILGFFYWVSRPPMPFFQKFGRFVVDFPLFLAVSMGLSLHNAVAVIEGLTGKKSAFVRTPKFAISTGKKGTWTDKKYRAPKISPLTILEFILLLYFASGLVWPFILRFSEKDGATRLTDFGLMPFHLMLTIGYFYVTYYSVKHARTN
jgi:cellulose synthase/poly-beta-1,6-N-acetylglucosamine synthase-like glycosyltransferase